MTDKTNPAGDAAMPVAQWQKRHPDYDDGVWKNTNEGDAKWWRDRSSLKDYEARPLVNLADALAALAVKDAEIAALKAQRMAYASEFPLDADSEPDTGSIHANIRAMKAEIAALKAGLAVIRDHFPAPAPAGALEQPWAEAMGAAECIPAYVAACIDARAAEIARLTREVESWYSQNQQHIQDAVDFAAERDAGFAEIVALRKAGQQALEALDNGLPEAREKAATALSKALAQAVQHG